MRSIALVAVLSAVILVAGCRKKPEYSAQVPPPPGGMPTVADAGALPPVTPDGQAPQAAGANNLFQPLPEVEPPAPAPGEPVVMTFRQPGAVQATPAPAPQPMLAAVPAGTGGNAYIVQKSDTLWSISQRFYGSGQRWRDIASANGIRDEKKLAVGQRIVIP